MTAVLLTPSFVRTELGAAAPADAPAVLAGFFPFAVFRLPETARGEAPRDGRFQRAAISGAARACSAL